MLIKESSILKKTDIMSQLSEAVYLDEEESKVQPITIPVREMSRLGEGVTMVRFADVESLAENHGISYMDAVSAIAEASKVDVSKMTIAVDEADLIADPSLLDEMTNIVVSSISDNDDVYKFCEAVTDTYIETGDESLLEALVNEASLKELKNDTKWVFGVMDKSLKKHGVHAFSHNRFANDELRIDTIKGIYDKYKDRPRNVIAKKIASLRKIYEKWMQKAKFEKDMGVASMLKKAAHALMTVIDKLLQLLQRGANKLG